MKVELKKESNQLDAIMDIEVTSSDILPKMESELKEQRKNIKIPGFRPGKVPIGLVKKMVGSDLKKDVVLKLAIEKLYNYLDENKIKVINKPIIENMEDAFKNQEQTDVFNLIFRLGLMPDIEPDTTVINKLNRYEAEITDKDIKNEIDIIKKQYADYEKQNEVIDDENIVFNMALNELDEKGNLLEGGINKSIHLSIKDIDEKLKKLVLGKKPQEKFILNINNFLSTNKEKANFFEIEENAANDLNEQFECEIFFVFRQQVAELNKSLYEKVLGTNEVEDFETFKDKIKESLESHYKSISNNILAREISKTIINENRVNLPETFISQWYEEYKEEVKEKVISEEEFRNEVSKRIILDKLIEINNIDTNEDEVKQNAQMVLYQEYQKSRQQVSESEFNKSLKNLLSNRDFTEKTKEDIKLNKLFQTLIENGNFRTEKLGINELMVKYRQ